MIKIDRYPDNLKERKRIKQKKQEIRKEWKKKESKERQKENGDKERQNKSTYSTLMREREREED